MSIKVPSDYEFPSTIEYLDICWVKNQLNLSQLTNLTHFSTESYSEHILPFPSRVTYFETHRPENNHYAVDIEPVKKFIGIGSNFAMGPDPQKLCELNVQTLKSSDLNDVRFSGFDNLPDYIEKNQ